MFTGIQANRHAQAIILLCFAAFVTVPLLSGAGHSPGVPAEPTTIGLWGGETQELTGVHVEDGSRVLSVPSRQLEDIAVDNERDAVWTALKKEIVKYDRKGNELLRIALPVGGISADNNKRDTKMSKPGRIDARKEHDDDRDDAGTALATRMHLSLDPADGSLWVGSGTWLIKYASDGRLLLKRTLPSFIVDVSVNIADGTCWAGRHDEAVQYSPDGQVLRTVRLEKGNQLSSLAADAVQSGLWVGSRKGLIRFDLHGRELFRSDEPRDIQDLKVDHGSGSLWLITKKVVYTFDGQGRALLRLQPCPDEREREHDHNDSERSSKVAIRSDGEECRSDDHHEDDHRQCEDNLVALAVEPASGSAFVAWRKAVLMLDRSGSALRWFEGFKQVEAIDAGLPLLTLAITAPENGATVDAQSVTVSGTVSDYGAKVTVNGREATVSGGTFEAREVPLAIGGNTITARATYLARRTSASTITVFRRSLRPPLTLRLASPQPGESLTTTRVTVTGTVSDPAATVVVNGVQATVSGSTFVAPNIPLYIGSNTITATAFDTYGQSAVDSLSVLMTWLTLSITSPEPGQELLEAATTVAGTVSDPAASVVVNGREAIVTGDGRFAASGIKLAEGWNDLIAQATNREGQSAEAVLQVAYLRPMSGSPDIQILAPFDRAVISAPTFTVFGTVNDPEATVIVNDVPAQITGNLFSAQVYACDEPGEPQGEGAGGCLITATVYTNDGRSATWYTSYTYAPSQDPLRVSITRPSRESKTSSPVVEVRGEVHDALAGLSPTLVMVNYYPAEVSGNTFTATIPLADGINYLTVSGVNMMGESAFDTVQVIYDPPAKPLAITVYRPFDGSIVNRPEIAVSGIVSDSTAAVTVNGIAADLPTPRSFVLPAVSLVEGENYITASARRANGEETTSSVTVIYDPNYPSPPAPRLSVLPVLTRSATTEVAGVALAGQHVEILLNGIFTTLAQADNGGLFTSPVGFLAEGLNHITARTRDGYGNLSELSNEAVIERDTIKPHIDVELIMHSLNVAISRVTLIGNTEPFADVVLSIDNEPGYRAARTADSNGRFGGELLLSAGRHNVSILATDRAGNKRSYSKIGTVYSPGARIPLKPTLDPLPSPVNSTAITVEGNAYARFRVALYRNGYPLGETVADERGRFQFEGVNLVQGSNILKVRQKEDQVDLGGSYFFLKAVESEDTMVEVVTEAPQRPAVKIDFPRDGSVTNAMHIPVRGTIDSTNAWMVVNGSYYSPVTGAWNRAGRFVSYEAIPLLPGKNILWVEAVSPDGSRGVDKIMVHYKTDAEVPAITVTTPHGEVYGRTVTVAGTVGAAQTVIANEAEAEVNGGTFSATTDLWGGGYTSRPDAGQEVFTAWAMDEAGRIGHHEVQVGYKYVPVPQITINTPADGQILDTPTAVISGTIADAVELTVNGRSVLISGGVFSTVVDLLPDRNSFNIIAKNGPRAAATTVVVYYLPASQVSLQSVALTPDPVAISLGKGKQITATGTYSDGRTANLTRTCYWGIEDDTIATVNAGYVQSKRYGRTIVTAQCYPFMNEVRVAVNEADIEEVQVSYEQLFPDGKTYYASDSPRSNPGDKINFRALGYYGNGRFDDLSAIVTWSSSNPAVAAPDAQGGATALALGRATITATYNDVSGSNTLTVVPPVITLVITSPGEYATTDKDRITVKGAVFSKATEVGVRVNGIPATVSGNQFVANHVPVPEGSSMIKVEASDTNGATANSQMIVRREASGNPLRLAASIESGIGPLETVIRIDGVPTDAIPDIKASGPGAVEFVDCASTDSCKIRMTAVGVYTVTVTSVGYDGNTYSDSIDITVLDRAKLDALLQAKWAGMKAALAKGDVEGAVGHVADSSKAAFRAEFRRVSGFLPDLVASMGLLRLVDLAEGYAEYDLRTVKDSATYSFQVLFMIDRDGAWRLKSF